MWKHKEGFSATSAILTFFLATSTTIVCPFVLADDCDKGNRIYDGIVFSSLPTERKIKELREAAELCPDLVKVRVELANLLLISSEVIKGNRREQNKRLDEAAAHLERAVREDEACVDAYRVLAKIYYTQGRFEMARTAYERLLAVQPSMSEAKIAVKELDQVIPRETRQLKKADEIKKSLDAFSKSNNLNLMGIQAFTIPKHRERFNNITFDEWSFSLKRESESQLGEIGKALKGMQSSGMRFAIEGHTDNRGDINRNQTLSENRSQAVKDYLVTRYGIDPSRITTQGFGFNRPLVPNDTPENMARNRRVEILFLDSPMTD